MSTRYLPTELQDADGNVVYPHSEADVIWMQDGRSVEALLARLDKLLETINGVSDSTELDDSTKLATAAAVEAVAGVVAELNKNLGGFTPVINSETGEITGYKTDIGGADAVFPFKSWEGYELPPFRIRIAANDLVTFALPLIGVKNISFHVGDHMCGANHYYFVTYENETVSTNNTISKNTDYSVDVEDAKCITFYFQTYNGEPTGVVEISDIVAL